MTTRLHWTTNKVANHTTACNWQVTTQSNEALPKKRLFVSCNPNSITVRVPRLGLNPDTLPRYVMFRQDKDCKAYEINKDMFELKINLRRNQLCGSIIRKSSRSRILYKNEVVFLDVNRVKIVSLLNFTCLYVGQDSVPVIPPSFNTATLLNIKMGIRFFRDDSFTEAALLTGDFPTVLVEEFLFVEIYAKNLKDIEGRNRTLFVDECFANFQSDPFIPLYRLIREGCASSEDSTVEVLNATSNSLIRFKVQMFKWVNLTIQRIYLFCNVSTGRSTTPSSYLEILKPPNCSTLQTNATWRRQQQGFTATPMEREESIILASGPIFPSVSALLRDRPNPNSNKKRTEPNLLVEGENVDPKIVRIVVGVIASLSLVIIALAGYALWRRRALRRKHQTPVVKVKEARIQPGFAFVLRSSEDAHIMNQQDNGKKLQQATQKYERRSSYNVAENGRNASQQENKKRHSLQLEMTTNT